MRTFIDLKDKQGAICVSDDAMSAPANAPVTRSEKDLYIGNATIVYGDTFITITGVGYVYGRDRIEVTIRVPWSSVLTVMQF